MLANNQKTNDAWDQKLANKWCIKSLQAKKQANIRITNEYSFR